MALAAHNPTDRAEQLIILTEKLTDMITRETKILDEKRASELVAFEKERTSLSTLYRHEMARIKEDKTLLQGIAPKLKEDLKATTLTFQNALSAHDKVLTRVRTISDKIIKAVADEITKKKSPTLSYGNNAAMKPRTTSTAAPITLNQIV